MSVTSSALYLLYYFSGAAGGVVPDEVSVPDDDQEPLRRHVSVLVLVTSRCPRSEVIFKKSSNLYDHLNLGVCYP